VRDSDYHDEGALVAGLKAGRPEAFRLAVTRYSPQMLATARAIAGPSNADDIVQDTWLTVFRQIDRFEQRSALGTWLQRIVSNRAISYLRSHAREVSTTVQGDEEPERDWFNAAGRWRAPLSGWDSGSPDELLIAGDLQDCLDKHLQLMPESQRQVVVMRDMQEQSFEDICNDLELSASNVRVLLHRGRMRLMKMVNHFQETGSC
jgi:RNA polymerase sigma-70 factor (ECF subfamily)